MHIQSHKYLLGSLYGRNWAGCRAFKDKMNKACPTPSESLQLTEKSVLLVPNPSQEMKPLSKHIITLYTLSAVTKEWTPHGD